RAGDRSAACGTRSVARGTRSVSPGVSGRPPRAPCLPEVAGRENLSAPGPPPIRSAVFLGPDVGEAGGTRPTVAPRSRRGGRLVSVDIETAPRATRHALTARGIALAAVVAGAIVVPTVAWQWRHVPMPIDLAVYRLAGMKVLHHIGDLYARGPDNAVYGT